MRLLLIEDDRRLNRALSLSLGEEGYAVDSQMAALLLRLGIAAPILLILCAAGGYWLADRALRPVHAITHAAQEISETDLSRRLNLQQRDELGALAATFDHMLDRLEAAFTCQRQFTADASHEIWLPVVDPPDLSASSQRNSTHST